MLGFSRFKFKKNLKLRTWKPTFSSVHYALFRDSNLSCYKAINERPNIKIGVILNSLAITD